VIDATGRSSVAADALPLVGREREQVVLRDRLAVALAGRGSLVLIGGEAGIGKTALAEALLRDAAEQGALVLVGRCYDLTETPPYGSWVEAFERLAAEHDRASLPAPLGNSEAVANQAVLFAQVRDFLAALAREQPLVLLLDDLHWADPASLDLLRSLARWVGTLPILVVVAYRADEVTRRHPLSQLLPLLVREAPVARLALRPLDLQDVAALVATCYPLPDPDAARLVAYLDRRAEGNPFFVGELLQALDEAGLLRPPSGGEGLWALGDLAQARLPSLVRQVIDGRVALSWPFTTSG
jgi:predicted ATPase